MVQNLEQMELWSKTQSTGNYRSEYRIQGIMEQNLEKMNYYGAEP